MEINALFGKNVFEKVENKENQILQNLKCIQLTFDIIYSFPQRGDTYLLATRIANIACTNHTHFMK